MNKLFRNSIAIGVVAMQLIVPMVALGLEDAPPIGDTNIEDLCGVVDLITKITNWMLFFLIILAIIFVIVAAFNYLGAGGDSEKVGEANKKIIYAAVAVAVGLLARAVPYIVASILGADIGSC